MQLLGQVLKRQLIIAAALILISIPFSYYFLNRLIVREAEEVLIIKQHRLYQRLQKLAGPSAFKLFFTTRDDIGMREVPAEIPLSDSLYRVKEYDTLSGEAIPYLLHSYTIALWGHKYQILQRESLIGDTSLIMVILKAQITLLLILLGLLLWINYRYSKVVWEPFYTTLHQLKQFKLEKAMELHLPESEIKEFNDLNTAIHMLASKSSHAYKAQKEFTENAAHELQTPIAIFRSKLEVLMQQEHLTVDDAALIGSLTEISDRLSRISKGLLLLTRIDNNQFIGKEEISLTGFMRELVLTFDEQIRSNALTCHFEADESMIYANADLIDILLSNLLSNAIRYNQRNGHLWIHIANRELSITNTGENTAISIARMYARFAKNSQHPQSIGLGLSIVKKICDICRYQLGYHFKSGDAMHTFTIKLEE